VPATALWASNTISPGAVATMQTDGNLVVRSRTGTPLWSSNTAGNPGATLDVQNDGGLVIYSKAGTPLWDRHVFIDRLPSGDQLKPGQPVVVSLNRQYLVIQQHDGNLVLYRGTIGGAKTALWASNTISPGAVATMQTDGNLVVRSSSGTPLWTPGTGKHPGAYLAVQNDGKLVIYSAAGTPLWATSTAGR
jgi:hypothetical protein